MAKKATITVTGIGLASGSPDQCRIHISLNHLAETAADALAVTAELATKAIAGLADIRAEECMCKRRAFPFRTSWIRPNRKSRRILVRTSWR
jgi:hypothetical protein